MVVTHRQHTAIIAGKNICIKDPGGNVVVRSSRFDGRDPKKAIDNYLDLMPFLREGWGSGKWGE